MQIYNVLKLQEKNEEMIIKCTNKHSVDLYVK